MHDDQLRDLFRTLESDREPDPAFADALFDRLTVVARGGRRGRPPLVLLAAALLLTVVGTGLALGFGLLQLPNLVVDASVSPTPSATASAVADASPSSRAELSAEPSDPSTAGLAHDSLVRTSVDALTVRAAAGRDAQSLGYLADGAVSFVVAGPVDADGYAWYLLSALGLPPASGCGPGQEGTEPYTCPIWFGWVASDDLDGTAWLEPATAECTEPPPAELQALTLGRPALELLHCYGGRELTFRAWWPEEEGSASNCDPDSDVAWLGCPTVVLGWDPGYWEAIGVAVDPETGPPFPARGQWIHVTAHMDDPASVSCGGAGDPTTEDQRAILRCRTQLVVTAVEPAPAP